MLSILGLLLATSANAKVDRCLDLPRWYQDYNEEYFRNMLPKDTVVERMEITDDAVALTTNVGGQFHIRFNPHYAMGSRLEHVILLHEMCHIETWTKTDHGKEWKGCMRRVDNMGALRGLLIEGY